MTPATVKTRVLLISDTHRAPLNEHGHPGSPFRLPLPKADLLIHCGDLTLSGGIPQYHETLDMLQRIDAPVKLVIAGNHDLSLDKDFMFTHRKADHATSEVNKARDLWLSPEGRAVKEGVTFLKEGVHQIQLQNGAHASIYASPYTPEFCDWAFPYNKDEDRFNGNQTSLSDAKNVTTCPVPSFSEAISPIDVLVTHGPPYARLDETDRGELVGCPHLLRALMRSRPLLHCFGHIHEGWGAERVKWSKSADTVAAAKCTIDSWKKGSWQEGVADGSKGKQIVPVPADIRAAVDEHAVFVDASSSSHNPLDRGRETLLVNAAIMDVRYRPINAPWVVDLDLPTAAH